MVPSPNPIRWDMGWGAILTAAAGVMYYNEWDKKLGIDGYIVVCQQDKTDEEIYYEMLTKKLEVERFRITRQVEQPFLSNAWEMFKAEWRMWLFPRMEAEEKFMRPLWRPLNEVRPELYDKAKREKLIYEMEMLKKFGQLTQGVAGGGHDRVLDDYIRQLREDFNDKQAENAAEPEEEHQPSAEELQKERAEVTRRAARKPEKQRVFYEPRDAKPPAAV